MIEIIKRIRDKKGTHRLVLTDIKTKKSRCVTLIVNDLSIDNAMDEIIEKIK